MNKIEKILRKIARELTLKWRIPARYIMERKIFLKINGKKVLLVGAAHYTANYPKLLGEGSRNELWTIDIDPRMREFGGKKHIIDNITNIDKYFKKEFFDIILLFGILGYGLNTKKEAEKAMKSCYKVLKKNGELIITWSDFEPKNKVMPEKLKNFKLFKRKSLYGYSSQYHAGKKGIFEFLIKK